VCPWNRDASVQCVHSGGRSTVTMSLHIRGHVGNCRLDAFKVHKTYTVYIRATTAKYSWSWFRSRYLGLVDLMCMWVHAAHNSIALVGTSCLHSVGRASPYVLEKGVGCLYGLEQDTWPVRLERWLLLIEAKTSKGCTSTPFFQNCTNTSVKSVMRGAHPRQQVGAVLRALQWITRD
jgi:hypothetical protein